MPGLRRILGGRVRVCTGTSQARACKPCLAALNLGGALHMAARATAASSSDPGSARVSVSQVWLLVDGLQARQKASKHATHLLEQLFGELPRQRLLQPGRLGLRAALRIPHRLPYSRMTGVVGCSWGPEGRQGACLAGSSPRIA